MAEQTTFLLEDTPNPTPKNMGERVAVLLCQPFAGPLDYAVLKGDAVPAAGSFVRVSLSGRVMTGVVWTSKAEGKVPHAKLKHIEAILEITPLGEDMMRFVDWVAAYTLAPIGSVLKMVLSSPDALKDPPMRQHVIKTGDIPARMTAARQKTLNAAGDTPLTVQTLAEQAGVSEAVVRGLVKLGALKSLDLPTDKPLPVPDLSVKGPTLNAEQAAATKAITDCVWEHRFQPFLLDGVTGSGKTEVYFEAIIEALKAPKAQVLVLVPEIALTSQWLARFEARFGAKPVIWHSDIGAAERRRAWRGVASGQARVVVGARSALFLPFQQLGLIVVDEEHDTSFKQEEGVLYHARDMAVLRAKIADCAIVLASATPSLESVVNAEQGRYEHLLLKERHGGAALPDMFTIDMRRDGTATAAEWLSPELIKHTEETLEAGEQAIFFLNRRGYAPLTLCRTCGHRFECPNCSAWLVEHRHHAGMQCHHCGYESKLPDHCPDCKKEDTLAACGPGVERLDEEVRKHFPKARIAVMTSDTMTSPQKTMEMVDHISQGLVDIIIGTQIVTKGYHFPNLTLVGVIDADLGLRGGDMRAAEHTYQQMMQVAGRAGRADKPGRVFLQTYEPDHPVTKALVSGDGEGFIRAEIESRAFYAMPPFGKLVGVIVSGFDMRGTASLARSLAKEAPRMKDVHILGPAPAPLARIRNTYRYRLLVRAPKDANVQKIMREWLSRVKPKKGIKIKVDIDPISFL